MELLRQIAGLREALRFPDGVGADELEALRLAAAGACARSETTPDEAVELLSILESGISRAPWATPDAAALFVQEALAGLEAVEHFLFALDDPEARVRLEERAAALRSISQEGVETPEKETAAPSGPTLDDLAALLVRMDPEDRAQTATLDETVREILNDAGLPDSVRTILAEAQDILTPVVTPKRVRKALRREAVERVGPVVEQALFALEEAIEEQFVEEVAPEPENAEAPADPAEPDVAPSAPAASSAPSVPTPPPAPTVPTAPTASEQEAPGSAAVPDLAPIPEAADPDLLQDFITEGLEYIDQAEEALLALEGAPDDAESVNVVFRAFHTIKGVAGFLELGLVTDLAHHAESVFSDVRDGSLVYSSSVADLALRSADVLKELLHNITRAMGDGGGIAVPASYAPLLSVLTAPDLAERLSSTEAEPVVERPAAPDESDEDASESTADKARSTHSTSAGEASVRVRTDRLDRLVDMVGELVIAHSMLAEDPLILADRASLAKKVDHAAKILRELQDLSTSLRMVPLKPAFRKVSRVVRDLGRKSGKPVRFISDGEDTELDRTMVDVIADPLVHMVRNSVDHGIETPAERERAGKPSEGTIRILAYQAGGTVVVEISDDGRGLDRDRIIARAKERGLVESDRGMTDAEIFDLIFAPGFSTAEKVTEVSGRGVGMDVVRRNVESLRGRVTVESEPGVGSTFRLHLPLTLAITEGMLIRVGRERYIIPSVKIQRSLRPEPSAISTVNGRAEMVLLQGDLVPILRLHRLFGISGAVENPSEALLVVIGEGSHRAALLVDELVNQQQFVVKALGGIVANTKGVSGGAILGNGEVGLILDPEGLIAMARDESRTAA